MKIYLPSSPIPFFQLLALTFKEAIHWAGHKDSGVQQRTASSSIHPVKAFFLAAYIPAGMPADVERITDIKWRLLEMAFSWIGWAFVYGVACTLGLYLSLLFISFCTRQLRTKPGKRTMISNSVGEMKKEIYVSTDTQTPRLTFIVNP
jgi:hypothetical protein